MLVYAFPAGLALHLGLRVKASSKFEWILRQNTAMCCDWIRKGNEGHWRD